MNLDDFIFYAIFIAILILVGVIAVGSAMAFLTYLGYVGG